MHDASSDRTEGEVERYLDGDAEAFSRLVARIRGRLENFIGVRLGRALRQRVDVDDVFQATLLQVVRSLDDFEDRGARSFERWIFQVANYRILDFAKAHNADIRDIRREVRDQLGNTSREEQRMLDRVAAGTRQSPLAEAARREAIERTIQAIERLPEKLREVIVARMLEQCTYQEIADRLGRPLTSVRAQHIRALEALKNELRQPGSQH